MNSINKRKERTFKLGYPSVAGATGSHVVALGDSDKVAVGESIVVVGNPEGFEKSVTNGLVSGLRTFDEQKLLRLVKQFPTLSFANGKSLKCAQGHPTNGRHRHQGAAARAYRAN